MKNIKYFALPILAAALLSGLGGCRKSPFTNEREEWRAVNEEISDNFYMYYYWEANLPTPKPMEFPDTDPFDYFKQLRSYSHDDNERQWSVLSDDRESFYASMANEGKSFGYSLSFWRFTDLDNQIMAVVQYVHPDTPAARAGIERGNIISLINGRTMTDGAPNDYRNLIYASSLDITVHDNIDDEAGHSVSIEAETGYLDPILENKVIERGAHKIAYLMYTDYVQASEKDLKTVFGTFKVAGATDLILDLRYNGGGTVSTALEMASLIAPATVLDGENIFSKFEYNEPYTALLDLVEGRLDEQTLVRYPSLGDMPQNLDMKRVYVLTSANTASASEQTIVGLQPFMEVVKVGTATHGKFTGGSVLPQSSDKDAMYGWGMYLIMFMYKNALDYPSANDGLVPDYEVAEEWRSYKPIGAEDDPLVARAISLITGQSEASSEAQSKATVHESPISRAAATAREMGCYHPGVEKGILIRQLGDETI